MTTSTTTGDEETSSVRYRWGVLTDLHLAEPTTPAARWHNTVRRDQSRDLLTAALSRLEDHNIDRVLLLGDLADGAAAVDYDYLLDHLGATGLPTWLIPGNHDRPTNRHGHFDSTVGGRTGWELPAGGAHLEHITVTTGALHGIDATEDDYTFGLDLPPCPDDELLVVLSHFPLLDLSPTLHDAGLANAGDLTNRAELAESLTSRQGPVLVLHGHQHIRAHTISRNVLQLGFAALAEQPHDLATLDVTLTARGPGTTDSISIEVRRRCYPVEAPPPGWKRSLLDPDETRFSWSQDSWRHLPGLGSE